MMRSSFLFPVQTTKDDDGFIYVNRDKRSRYAAFFDNELKSIIIQT